MTAPDWLMARPIAHRGLHASGRGILENTKSAAGAAIEAGCAIECDVQLSADGEAMVFHDFVLDRLTCASGRVDQLPARVLGEIALKVGDDRILPLARFVDFIAGRTPLICEIKSRFDGDLRLARRAAAVAAAAPGPVALKSFDPDIIAMLRDEAKAAGRRHTPLGVVAMADFHDEEAAITAGMRRSLSAFLHWPRSRPDFLSYCVDDLPNAAPFLLRQALGVPVMTWTVRRREQAAAARRWADQIIFEGDPKGFAEVMAPSSACPVKAPD